MVTLTDGQGQDCMKLLFEPRAELHSVGLASLLPCAVRGRISSHSNWVPAQGLVERPPSEGVANLDGVDVRL
jgi:hypothetical protein